MSIVEPALQSKLRSWTVTVAAMVLFIFALAGVMAAAAIQSRNRTLVEAERVTVDAARLLQAQVGYVLDVASTILALLDEQAKKSDFTDPAERARVSATMRDLLRDKPYIFRVFLAEANGDLVASSMEKTPALSTTTRPYFPRHLSGEMGPLLSTGLQSQASGEPLMVLSRRVNDGEGQFAGVAILSFDLGALRRYFTDVAPKEFGAVFQLIAPDMMVLVDVSPPPDEQGKYIAANEAARLKDQEPARYRSASDDVDRIWVNRSIANQPLYIRIGTSVKSISARWKQDVASYAFGVGIALLALIVLLGFVVRFGIREERAVAAVRDLNAELETRVQERTAQLEKLTGELTQSLKDKDVLFKEIHHRVKNNLQVVSSMVRFSSSRVSDPDAKSVFEEIARRIRAIGLVHQTIYEQHATTRVALGPYIRQLAELEGDVYGASDRGVDIVVESTGELDLNNAISTGLIISELLSNSLKHAFNSKSGGRVMIRVHQGEGECSLSVQDNGVGLAPNAPSNTGLSIVRAIAAQLNAKLSINSDGGTAIGLSFAVIA